MQEQTSSIRQWQNISMLRACCNPERRRWRRTAATARNIDSGISIAYNDAANTITIWAVGSTGAYAQGTYFYLLGTKR